MMLSRFLGLAMSTALVGTALGCAPAVPNADVSAPAPIPLVQNITEGSIPPDQLLQSDRQIMVDGQAMNFDQIRKQLPSRILEADAAKLLVKIDPAKVVENDKEIQQWGRGFARGFARGWGRGFGRGFYGGYGGYGPFSYYPFGGCYFPYYSYGGCYYPYSYPYSGLSCYPYLYGYGGGFYPFNYCW